MKLEKCSRCEIEYPQNILAPITGSVVTGNVCGICAREIRLVNHGIDIPFSKGSMAAFFESEAIKWRKRNKND